MLSSCGFGDVNIFDKFDKQEKDGSVIEFDIVD